MFILPHLKGLTAGYLGSAVFKNAGLDLKFAENKSLVDSISGNSLVTFARADAVANSATYVGSDGLLKTATINEARFDHNPTTGESLGLLVEEARTNSIRNNTMVGAVVGTPGTTPTNWTVGGSGIGTLTQQVVAIGSLGSLSYIDVRYSGTTSTTGFIFAFEPSTSVAALTGQSWTQSVYFALIAGSISNINSLRHDVVERTLVGGSVLQNFSSDFKSTLTANLTRSTYSVALSGGATTAYAQPSIEFSFASGVAIDITLRIGLPQLEQGAFATSVIPTTTATVTRAADVASITGSNFSSFYNQTEGTVYCDALGLGAGVPISDFQSLATFSDGTNTTRIELGYLSASSAYWNLRSAGLSSVEISPTVSAARRLLAASYSSALAEISVNGAAALSDSSVTVPLVNKLDIGGANGAAIKEFNGHIRRFVFWPTRLINTTLELITQA